MKERTTGQFSPGNGVAAATHVIGSDPLKDPTMRYLSIRNKNLYVKF